MTDMPDTQRPDGAPQPVIDPAVLDRILGIGDARLREALLDQLLADFRRLAEALSGAGAGLGAAAHEVKGLAATIGAHRLAHLAKRLDAAESALPDKLGEISAQVRGEIGVVLDALRRHADRVRP